MKLFIVAALVAVASAARLEHLERSYLPPDQGSNQGRYGSQSGFGSQGPSRFGGSGSFGSSGSFGGSGSHGLGGHGGFGPSGSFDNNGIETPSIAARSSGSSAFPGATINQYLPPNHGPAGANGAQFSGSLQGFNQRSQYTPQSSFGGSSQYSPSSQYEAPSSFGSQSRYQQAGGQQFGQGQGSSQFPATSRQYLAPQSNYPQQAFDEKTGYQY